MERDVDEYTTSHSSTIDAMAKERGRQINFQRKAFPWPFHIYGKCFPVNHYQKYVLIVNWCYYFLFQLALLVLRTCPDVWDNQWMFNYCSHTIFRRNQDLSLIIGKSKSLVDLWEILILYMTKESSSHSVTRVIPGFFRVLFWGLNIWPSHRDALLRQKPKSARIT